ncbi:MAG: nucleoside 2-deoxyribosyltransferase domain-containing protein [Acidobacteria bacterium]|nr:nucleoside 2-deoxyribosyltransferase domain-containing protein [Acidobacteriota bacterium]
MYKQVFLGGAAGETTWRRDIAIPALAAAGVTYFDPQLGLGEWTEECEAAEMLAKDEADVLLFVISAETRGVATVAEVAYYLGIGRQLALVITDLPENSSIYGQRITDTERNDLNRGRIFLRTMANAHRVPVFATVEAAVEYAITKAKAQRVPMDLDAIRGILAEVRCGECNFRAEQIDSGFLLHISAAIPDALTQRIQDYTGRKWHIDPHASRGEIVRTALKAALTWQEHETRERFTYRGKAIFGPHCNID